MSDEVITEQTEATPVEQEQVTQPAEATETPKIDFSAQFAELSRRDKEVRAKEHKVKSSLDQAKSAWVEELKANPIAALKQYGINADVIAESLLNQGMDAEQPETVQTPMGIDPELKKEIEDLKAYKQQQLVAEYRNKVFSVVESKADQYELLLQSDQGKDAYWNAAVNYYQTYGTEPDYAKLAEGVENALFQQGQAMLKANKFASLLKPEETAPAETEVVNESKTMKTLSKALRPDAMASNPRYTIQKIDSDGPTTAVGATRATRDELKKQILAKFKD